MRQAGLAEELVRTVDEHRVPGASVGVYHAGSQWYACHGITSVDNPLPVDEGTLFQVGSIGKTLTATVVMCLVERGQVDLDERVRHYLPGFRVREESVSQDVTVRHLLNHTAGWQGDLEIDTGEGDDALARYIELMADFGRDVPLGVGVSYNNASLSVAARVIEVVTGRSFEQVVHDVVLEPLGLGETFFFKDDIMTRRFAAGHQLGDDGAQAVVRPGMRSTVTWSGGCWLNGPGDRYIAAAPYSFLRGFFARDADGRVSAINFGGRLAARSPAQQPVSQES